MLRKLAETRMPLWHLLTSCMMHGEMGWIGAMQGGSVTDRCNTPSPNPENHVEAKTPFLVWGIMGCVTSKRKDMMSSVSPLTTKVCPPHCLKDIWNRVISPKKSKAIDVIHYVWKEKTNWVQPCKESLMKILFLMFNTHTAYYLRINTFPLSLLQDVSIIWYTLSNLHMTRQCGRVKRTVLRSPKSGRCTQRGSCRATTAVTQAGWRTAVYATQSQDHADAVVPRRPLSASLDSQTRSTNSTASTATRATTECTNCMTHELSVIM